MKHGGGLRLAVETWLETNGIVVDRVDYAEYPSIFEKSFEVVIKCKVEPAEFNEADRCGEATIELSHHDLMSVIYGRNEAISASMPCR